MPLARISSPTRFAHVVLITLAIHLVTPSSTDAAQTTDWKPAAGPLMTRWAKDVSPEKALPEYPRPQMVRKDWTNLNGLWDYAIRPKDEPQPAEFTGQILVPFPIESALSGVMKPVGDANRLWYRRTFRAIKPKDGSRLLLHFGAVDWHATVFINGKQVGEHKGGYDPFTLDITDALASDPGQEIVVSVWDPTDKGTQPRGKQVEKPHSIWYTAVTGIWQTVWIEPVPKAHIESLKIVPDVDRQLVNVTVKVRGGADNHTLRISALWDKIEKGDTVVYGSESAVDSNGLEDTHELPIRTGKLWTPDAPFLYDLQVELVEGDKNVVDAVTSYFGMRKISVGKDKAGVNRLLLNSEPLFQLGPLDQGWWPDGLYTAPTDEALKYDVEITRKLGFNMARKHVKVEPDRWYYWCDKLGLMVWQDMPSGDRYIGGNDPDIKRSPESAGQFEREWAGIIASRFNHPSIVMWVPFNEGWGQFDTARVVDLTRKLDPTRLVNNASGWTDRGVGDVNDIHVYPGPGMPKLEDKRAAVLGEFGGLGLPLDGHTWQAKDNWGYRSFKSREELGPAYEALYAQLRLLAADGLSAAVYTQTTDVEIEVNGLLTYDRAIIKVPEGVAAIHQRLYGPPPKVRVLVPTSRTDPQTWKYTTTKPVDAWTKSDFDDSAWSRGPGGFGTKVTPGAVIGTEWKTGDIWLRSTVDLLDVRNFVTAVGDGSGRSKPLDLYLQIHHDEDAEVYIDGQLVASLPGYTTNYILWPLDSKARDALRASTNPNPTIAVHCHQTGGGQYIDVGLVAVSETSK